MSYLLDTNHCSYIINGNPQVTDALKSYAGLTIGVSIITTSVESCNKTLQSWRFTQVKPIVY
jgi:predicted nucleic acid-binding protein